MTPGTGQLEVSLKVHEVDATGSEVRILTEEDLAVDAIGVHHGPVPTLAYRVTIRDQIIVVGADGSGRDEAFVGFAQGADVLILPHAIAEGAGEAARELHTRPSEIAAEPSHEGKFAVPAHDLQCITLD